MRQSVSVERLREMLDYNPETGRLTWRERDRNLTGVEAGGIDPGHGYRRIKVGPKYELGHRVAIALTTGKWPSDEVDHINGDRSDNRLCNLRCVPRGGNMLNKSRYRNNKSGIIGVHWHRQHRKWCATIQRGGRSHQVGLFRCIGAAAVARHLAEVEHGFHPNHGRQGK